MRLTVKNQAVKAHFGLKKGKEVEPIAFQNIGKESNKVHSVKEAKVATKGEKGDVNDDSSSPENALP